MFGHLLYGCAWQQATVLVTAYIQNTYKETQGSNTKEEGQNHALRHIASIVIARWRV